MKSLHEKILKEGEVLGGNILKVDGFLNHRIDIDFLNEIGKEFKNLFSDSKIDKIVTIEASGIGIACIAAQYFKVPVVFAKKTDSSNIGKDLYKAKVSSFTKGKIYDIVISKKYLQKGENILIIDDFLAQGNALLGLASLVEEAECNLVGCGICIEKAFQEGGKIIRDMGIRVESLAIISSMKDGKVNFID